MHFPRTASPFPADFDFQLLSPPVPFLSFRTVGLTADFFNRLDVQGIGEAGTRHLRSLTRGQTDWQEFPAGHSKRFQAMKRGQWIDSQQVP
jgi:hypothetical protein